MSEGRREDVPKKRKKNLNSAGGAGQLFFSFQRSNKRKESQAVDGSCLTAPAPRLTRRSGRQREKFGSGSLVLFPCICIYISPMAPPSARSVSTDYIYFCIREDGLRRLCSREREKRKRGRAPLTAAAAVEREAGVLPALLFLNSQGGWWRRGKRRRHPVQWWCSIPRHIPNAVR